MTLRLNKQFVQLFKSSPYTDVREFDADLINNISCWDLVDDDDSIFGYTLQECMKDEDLPILTKVLGEIGIEPTESNMEALLGIVFMDDYDCEDCGGEMVVTDVQTSCVGGDGYNTPYEYEEWITKTCKVCGKSIVEHNIY